MHWVEYTLDIEPSMREAVEAVCSRHARNVSVEEIKGDTRERVRAYLPASARKRRVELEIALDLLAATTPFRSTSPSVDSGLRLGRAGSEREGVKGGMAP